MKLLSIFAIPAALLCVSSCAQKIGVVDVIPMPQTVELTGVNVRASAMNTISAGEGLTNEAEALANMLKDYTTCSIVEGKGKVTLSIDESMKAEEYELVVKKDKINLKGGSPAAVFYGIQTLFQETNSYDGNIKVGKIHDCPRYSWRGFMLDESRHFFGEDFVKQTLDMMASYKLNKFHWHLTDAPGWRIEIKAYPQLTAVGSLGDIENPDGPAQFYTQDQIREIVAYAAERHIDIIPEIDMPGHASSATRSYPELSVGGAGSFTYNPGKPEVYEFIHNVLKEVAGLFPYDYIHIGGDEVFMGNKTWAEDPDIKALMEREGMTKIEDAEAYFLKWVAPQIDSLGKKMIAWDDVLDLGAGHCGTALTWWRQERPDHLEEGAKDGYEMILCPRLPLYLDFVQDSTHAYGRKTWGSKKVQCGLHEIYDFPDSLFSGCSVDQTKIIGMQANLWSEMVATPKRAQFMMYPRMCALAESAWTQPDRKNYGSFYKRLEPVYRLYNSIGIYYYDYRFPTRHREPSR